MQPRTPSTMNFTMFILAFIMIFIIAGLLCKAMLIGGVTLLPLLTLSAVFTTIVVLVGAFQAFTALCFVSDKNPIGAWDLDLRSV